jgi:hypothetical protein
MAEQQRITDIETFAEHFRLKITRDECNDQIIQGSRAHLYFDDDRLCLMATDTRVSGMSTEAVAALGAKCWIGDIWRDAKNRGHRDLWVRDIPPANYRKAFGLARCRVAPILSEEERKRRRLLGIRLASMRPNKKPTVESVECICDGIHEEFLVRAVLMRIGKIL